VTFSGEKMRARIVCRISRLADPRDNVPYVPDILQLFLGLLILLSVLIIKLNLSRR